MDSQTLRDWVIRFNEQGPDGLINIPSPGVPPKLEEEHEEGPTPPIHGVVRWRGPIGDVGPANGFASIRSL
jgi:hypothetical protein